MTEADFFIFAMIMGVAGCFIASSIAKHIAIRKGEFDAEWDW